MSRFVRTAATTAIAIGLAAGCDSVEGIDAPDASLTPAPGNLRARLTEVPADVTRDSVARFAFTAPATASLRCLLDDEPMPTCTSPLSTPPLGDGQHHFSVIAIDDAGRTAPSPSASRASRSRAAPAR